MGPRPQLDIDFNILSGAALNLEEETEPNFQQNIALGFSVVMHPVCPRQSRFKVTLCLPKGAPKPYVGSDRI